MTQKFYHINKIFFVIIKNTFKVTFQYIFNVFILFKTVPYIEIKLKLKWTQKCVLLKTWKKLGKPGKFFDKTNEWQPWFVYELN